MIYFKKAIRLNFIVFGVLTAVMLVLALTGFVLRGEPFQTIFHYIGIVYLFVIALTVVALIATFIIGAMQMVKNRGIKKLALKTSLFFTSGVAATIIISLIRFREIFNVNLCYIPIVAVMMPSILYVIDESKKDVI